jgi:hypothetical protein
MDAVSAGIFSSTRPVPRWWPLKYRYGDTERDISPGVYPNVSLERARYKR